MNYFVRQYYGWGTHFVLGDTQKLYVLVRLRFCCEGRRSMIKYDLNQTLTNCCCFVGKQFFSQKNCNFSEIAS